MGLPGNFFPTVVTFWEWLGPDKILHLCVFGLLSFLILFGYREKIKAGDRKFKRTMYVVSLALSISYGALTELLQKYVFINRFGSLLDFIADAIGCVLGLIIYFFIFEKKIKKNVN